ncbi:hypothetical protein F2Q69_00037033 [Brassica cretica]|uniref:Uncharacterized protein n=1 Tax=Brassica cretica TaxID=69181 RepID=A0A8S9SCS7_BRACR|nr:hypothetical protein F2Q69_00037033 [Brassica cretica]
MPRDVRDQCARFRASPRSNHGFRGCDDYFDLRFPYRFQPDSIHFKVRDMFSAYVTCMILPFSSLREEYVFEKMRLQRLAMPKIDFFFRMPRFVLEMFAGLKMFRDIARDVFTQIAKDVVGQGLDHGTLTFKDVFTQIAKDVVGQGLDHGTLTFKVKVAWSYSWSVTEVYFTTIQSQNVFHWFFERILMTHSFLERIGQPEVDLANDREESVPFNVLDATFIVEFSSS